MLNSRSRSSTAGSNGVAASSSAKRPINNNGRKRSAKNGKKKQKTMTASKHNDDDDDDDDEEARESRAHRRSSQWAVLTTLPLQAPIIQPASVPPLTDPNSTLQAATPTIASGSEVDGVQIATVSIGNKTTGVPCDSSLSHCGSVTMTNEQQQEVLKFMKCFGSEGGIVDAKRVKDFVVAKLFHIVKFLASSEMLNTFVRKLVEVGMNIPLVIRSDTWWHRHRKLVRNAIGEKRSNITCDMKRRFLKGKLFMCNHCYQIQKSTITNILLPPFHSK